MTVDTSLRTFFSRLQTAFRDALEGGIPTEGVKLKISDENGSIEAVNESGQAFLDAILSVAERVECPSSQGDGRARMIATTLSCVLHDKGISVFRPQHEPA